MNSDIKGTLSFTREILTTAILTLFKKTQGKKPPKQKIRLRAALRNKCKQIIYSLYFIQNAGEFFKVHELLHDHHSKELYKKLILFRLTGPKHIKIKDTLSWDHEEKALNLIQQFYSGPSNLDLLTHPLFGTLNYYNNIPTESGNISLDSWAYSLIYVALKKQYYFEGNKINVKPENGDVVIDAGGCLGDNAVYFAKSVGPRGHIYIFDPLPAHEKVIKKNITQNQLTDQITYSSFALGKKSTNLAINKSPKSHSSLLPDPTFQVASNMEFPIISIDDFVKNNNINKVDFIKMDIEGYEMLALEGAVDTIKKFKPKLAISIYHKWQDFYAIPLWIHELVDEYIFFIDHYTAHTGETILYAITKR